MLSKIQRRNKTKLVQRFELDFPVLEMLSDFMSQSHALPLLDVIRILESFPNGHLKVDIYSDVFILMQATFKMQKWHLKRNIRP